NPWRGRPLARTPFFSPTASALLHCQPFRPPSAVRPYPFRVRVCAMKRSLLDLLVPLSVAGTAPAEPGRENVGFVVGGSNHFAADLFGRLRETDGNVVFSPYALNSSLAMTSAGARGPTLTALDKAAHLPSQDKLHPAYRAYNTTVDNESSRARGFRVTLAADLRGGRAVTFRDDFLALARANY